MPFSISRQFAILRAMKVQILNKTQEHKWTEFIEDHPLATVHQSLPWIHFQEKVATRGRYWILALMQKDKIIGGTVLLRHKLPRGFSWLYASRGPLIDYTDNPQQAIELILEAIRPIAKRENSVFLRIDPPLEKNPPKLKGFKESPAGFYPEHTLILDLTPSEEEILKQMKPKGRYNIKVAKKHGVQIISVDSKAKNFENYLGAYHKIVSETTERDGFYAHRKSFYRAMVQTLDEEKAGKLYLARYKGKIISGLLATYFKDTATYYYGASSNANRNIMAPYLLQWQAIQDAKQAGYQYYDFLGISPPDKPNHPWAGVTSFKRKFGGYHRAYIRCQEYSFKPFIHLLYKIRKWFKKLSTG